MTQFVPGKTVSDQAAPLSPSPSPIPAFSSRSRTEDADLYKKFTSERRRI